MQHEASEHAIKGWKYRLEGWFWVVNFEDDSTEGGSKVQSCDAAAHKLTAYKGAQYEENSRI